MKHAKNILVFMVALLFAACENVPSTPQAIAFDSLKAAGAAIDSYRRDVEFAKQQGTVTEEQWHRFAVKYNAINDKIIAAAQTLKIVVTASDPNWQPSTPEINALVAELLRLVQEILPARRVSLNFFDSQPKMVNIPLEAY